MKSSGNRIKHRQTTGNARPKTASARLRPFVFFMAALAIALPAAALQIQPTYQVFEAKAGSTFQGRLTLTNNEPETLVLTPSVKEWFKLNVNEKTHVEDWLRIDDDPITLEPGQSREFRFKIQVPKKASGELAGGLSFTNKADLISMQLTVVMYVGVSGTEKVEHRVDAVAVRVSSNTNVGVLISNLGNVHLRPTGWVYLDDEDGKRVLNAQIVPGSPIFPGTQRAISTEIGAYRLPPGKYTAVVELKDVDRPKHEYPRVKKKIVVAEEGNAEAR